MPAKREENPFIYGELVTETAFVNRTQELDQLARDLADGQKIFLLSPRRFGKSSLVAAVFERLKKQSIRTVTVPVSSSTTYTEFLERFADQVLRAAGPWHTVKTWVERFFRQVRPEASVDPWSSEIKLTLGKGSAFDPTPIAPEVFALPAQVTKSGGFRVAICLDEFQQIQHFGGIAVENALRNAVQSQRQVGYVFSGSQPSVMEAMLSPKRPFHKAGPRMFLDKIPAAAWQEFVPAQFARRARTLAPAALDLLLATADHIPYDVQRLAHELWDHAELTDTKKLDVKEVELVTRRIVVSDAPQYEQRWERLALGQRAVLQALASGQATAIYSTAVREQHRLGPSSSVRKALLYLHAQDILGTYQGNHFFVDPLFAVWIRDHR